MSDESPLRLGIVAESPQDARTLSRLADRVLLDEHDWLDGVLEHVRRWQGRSEAEEYFDIHHTSRTLRARGIKVHGHFSGEPGAPDARQFRGLLVLFKAQSPQVSALVIGRDLDSEPDRARGLRQALGAVTTPFKVVGALADPEIETWFCAGFVPEDDTERQRLVDQLKELGFRPDQSPERLSAGRDHHKTNAKRVLAVLVDGDGARRAACLETNLQTLETNGQNCGLADYIRDVRAEIASLLG